MNDDRGTVRAIAWDEVFPWLILLRTFRIAACGRMLVLATAAMLLTWASWWAASALLASDRAVGGWLFEGEQALGQWDEPVGPALGPEPDPWQPGRGAMQVWSPLNPLAQAWLVLPRPVVALFQRGVHWGDVPALALAGLCTLAIWAFFGAAIVRMAAVQLAAGERLPFTSAMKHACRKWPSYVGAPLFPLGGIFLATFFVAVLGLLMRVDAGAVVVAVVWPLAILCGLIITLLLLGLGFGWPLMWPAIGVEAGDSYAAISRSYSYVFQRPLHYLFYALVAAVLGALGWLLVSNFARWVIEMTYWAAAWGAGWDRLQTIVLGGPGSSMLGFWTNLVLAVARAFLFSYLWVAATGIYLLLRRDVDGNELDDVVFEDERLDPSYSVPTLHGNGESTAPGRSLPGLASDE